MDDLLREFLTETNESLDVVDVELVRFEADPNNAAILNNIFRLVHTIKGTCGFLNLPRLEALTHAAEALMGNFRGGMPVTTDAVTLILATIDRIKALLNALERNEVEAVGDDGDLIAQLKLMAVQTDASVAAAFTHAAQCEVGREDVAPEPPARRLRAKAKPIPAPQPANGRAEPVPAATGPAEREDDRVEGKIAGQSIRVHVDTLERLMTTVSELVLTRNQLLEIVRRHQDSEFKAPLQRLSNVTAELQDGVMKTRMQPIGNAWQKLPRIGVRNVRRRDRA
jgi:two-component system chemotaxis sensor kinase CheA